MSGREKKSHFRAHYLFWPKILLDPNRQNHEKLSKLWFQWKLPKTKNDTFFLKKVFFDMGEKVGFTICVFESCVLLKSLVALYCTIPRDYLSDTPLLRAMGFLVSQHCQLGAIPPPPFLSISPLQSMRSGGAIPPLQKSISVILARYPMKTRQMGVIPPSAILSRKGLAR